MEKRRDKRIDLKYPLSVKCRIQKFKDTYGLIRTTSLQVENISMGGLRFSSPLNFPVTQDLVLSLEFTLLGRDCRLLGTIVWKEETSNHYVYGFETTSSNIGYMQSVSLFTKG